jgi:hypothetical protein
MLQKIEFPESNCFVWFSLESNVELHQEHTLKSYTIFNTLFILAMP